MRKFLFLMFLLVPVIGWATVLPKAAGPSPFIPGSSTQQLPHPWTTLHLPHALGAYFSHSVVEIFEYGCPYCRALNGQLRTWGRSLPKEYGFTQMPALLSKEFIPMSLATFAVERYEPQDLGAFERNAFTLVQGYHRSINNPRVYIAAAVHAGIAPKAFLAQLQTTSTLQLTHIDYLLMRASLIHQTPTLVICGRYAINPSQVRGNYSVFLELANGLLSRCMRSR